VCRAPDLQWDHDIAPDGAGGAVVSWRDFREATPRVFAQRIDHDGLPLWGGDGVRVSRRDAFTKHPSLAGTGGGRVFLALVMREHGVPRVAVHRLSNEDAITVDERCEYAADVRTDGITVSWTGGVGRKGGAYEILRCVADEDSFLALGDSDVRREAERCFFTDAAVSPGESYRYRVELVDPMGRRTLFETDPIGVKPLPLELYPNFPNPFGRSTFIRYYLPERGPIRLAVYGVTGRRIATLLDGTAERGFHAVTWHGRNDRGRIVAPGVYFMRIETAGGTAARSMIMLR
jgi:hypothetical protein